MRGGSPFSPSQRAVIPHTAAQIVVSPGPHPITLSLGSLRERPERSSALCGARAAWQPGAACRRGARGRAGGRRPRRGRGGQYNVGPYCTVDEVLGKR